MTSRILTVFLPVLAVLLISGNAIAGRTDVAFALRPGIVDLKNCGPTGMYQPTQREVSDIVDCMSAAPKVEKIYDMAFGYYLFEGKGEDKVRQCLTNTHGWKQLGPPKCKEGTMASPYPLEPWRK